MSDVLPLVIIVCFILTLVILIPLILASTRIVKEYERAVIFRFGRCIGVKGPGLFFILLGIDKFLVVDLRTITYDARMIKIITKDNIRCDVDSVVYYRVVDPKKALIEVADYTHATQNLAKTVLREVLGHAELDDLLTKTNELTKEIQEIIDEKTDPWGIKVTNVAISDVLLPEEMQRAIAKQAEAERERRSRIIIAEGEYLAAEKMLKAAETYGKSPITLKLRELQTLTDIAKEKNLIVVTSTTDVHEMGRIIALSRESSKSYETKT
jgi:regulator of protease activity HflC (stomatin/prohibitin superfamily)